MSAFDPHSATRRSLFVVCILNISYLLFPAVVESIPADCLGSVTWNNPSSDVPGTWFPYVDQATNVDDRALANM
jgi:hypothetical protein